MKQVLWKIVEIMTWVFQNRHTLAKQEWVILPLSPK